MKRLTFDGRFNLKRLAADVARVPGLAPIPDPTLPDPATGGLGAMRSRVVVSGTDTTAHLDVPDDFDPAELDAVLAAHDPRADGPPPPPPETPAQKLAKMQAPRVITGSRSVD